MIEAVDESSLDGPASVSLSVDLPDLISTPVLGSWLPWAVSWAVLKIDTTESRTPARYKVWRQTRPLCQFPSPTSNTVFKPREILRGPIGCWSTPRKASERAVRRDHITSHWTASRIFSLDYWWSKCLSLGQGPLVRAVPAVPAAAAQGTCMAKKPGSPSGPRPAHASCFAVVYLRGTCSLRTIKVGG
jgi:hypothetical protein